MKRLRPLDVVLLAILVPLWLACFALHVREVARDRLARVAVWVTDPGTAASYPIVRGFWGLQAENSGLVVDDQLVRLGQTDLRGVSPLDFLALAYKESQSTLQVPVGFMRAGAPGNTVLRFDPVLSPWQKVLMTLGFAVTAILVLLRRPGSRAARAFFLTCMTYSIHWCFFFGGESPTQTYAWVVMYDLSSLVIFPLAIRAALVLPEETAPTSWWMYAWPWLFALRGPTAHSWYFGSPLPHAMGMLATNMLEAAFMVALLLVLARNFHQASPLGRRQLKWVVYGLYIGTLPALVTSVIAMLEPRLWWLQEASMFAMMLTPICMCIALVRYNLFDIDRLMSITAGYSILLIVIGGGLWLVLPTVSHAASSLAGISQPVILAMTLPILILVAMPSQRRLRSSIERWFFAERYAVDRGMQELLRALPRCIDRRSLLTLVGERLHAIFKAENGIVYEKRDDTYVPLLVYGSIVAPPIDEQHPLISALQSRPFPLDVNQWRESARVHLTQDNLVLLDRLRPAVALPMKQQDSHFVLSLGKKQSGDVYTSTDLTLLTTTLNKVGEELRRVESGLERT